jgi:hypothetical protein
MIFAYLRIALLACIYEQLLLISIWCVCQEKLAPTKLSCSSAESSPGAKEFEIVGNLRGKVHRHFGQSCRRHHLRSVSKKQSFIFEWPAGIDHRWLRSSDYPQRSSSCESAVDELGRNQIDESDTGPRGHLNLKSDKRHLNAGFFQRLQI